MVEPSLVRKIFRNNSKSQKGSLKPGSALPYYNIDKAVETAAAHMDNSRLNDQQHSNLGQTLDHSGELDNVVVDGRLYPREVTYQPHTDAGGDAYYIGDIYEPIRCEEGPDGWAVTLSDERPYLKYVKRVSEHLPHLDYLAHWMQVTAAPPLWKFLKRHRKHVEERACRTNVCVIDYDPAGQLTSHPNFTDCGALKAQLDACPQEAKSVRLIVVEDLSRDVVEFLGGCYDIDPLFFLSHISDHMLHNIRDRWVELPDLDVIARRRNHLNLQYLRARYFKTEESYDEAERATGLFNVLRRIEGDRSRRRLQSAFSDGVLGTSVTLTRAKTSLWWKPRLEGKESEQPVLAILLVDPTVKQGFNLWGGYRPFEPTPSMHDVERYEAPVNNSLFEIVIYWSSRLTSDDLENVRRNEKNIGVPMYRIVLAEWRTVLKYISTMISRIEWEFERPHYRLDTGDIDKIMRRISPWHRSILSYRQMANESINYLFPSDARMKSTANQFEPEDGIMSLLHDFQLVQQHMDEYKQRIDRILTVTVSTINIEDTKLALLQNQHITRLTFLASTFIPLNFATSFLSMSPDFHAGSTVWLFFVIGLPLTILVLVIVDLCNPQVPYLLRQMDMFRRKRRGL